MVIREVAATHRLPFVAHRQKTAVFTPFFTLIRTNMDGRNGRFICVPSYL
ncbi:MAG: hypothetical protein R3C62_19030 [Chloroflexota bacterium]